MRFPEGIKDLCDLHSKYADQPGEFDKAFGGAMIAAPAVENVEAEESTEPKTEGEATANESSGDCVKTTCFSDIEPQEIKWLWPKRFARGKVSLLVGDPGLGKSFITLDMAARLSTGCDWPDGTACAVGESIIVNCEDDPADTLRPRLDAAGADVSKIHFLECVMSRDKQGKPSERFFTLTDIPALAVMLQNNPAIKMISIDPVSAYMGCIDSHKNSDVRGLLAPLAGLAAKYDVAVVLVSHKNKGQNGSAINRIVGSIAMGAAARAAWGIERDPDNPERRIMGALKNNLGKDSGCLAYRLESVGESAVIVWEPALDIDFGALVTGFQDRGGPEQREAAEFLKGELADGPMPYKEILALAKEQGISKRTLDRAKSLAGVKSHKAGLTNWNWELSKPSTEAA
jgi:hypothetical protein